MHHGNRRTLLVAAFALIFAVAPLAAGAERHALGSVWVHRNATDGMTLHAAGDSSCTMEFPTGCLGMMMMGPDSVHCEFRRAMPDSALDSCLVTMRCDVHGQDGGCMISGGMTPSGLFRRPLSLTFRYDPAQLATAGIDPVNLVLATWAANRFEIATQAVHDTAAGTFNLTSTRLAGWYVIADRSNLPLPVASTTWNGMKVRYR